MVCAATNHWQMPKKMIQHSTEWPSCFRWRLVLGCSRTSLGEEFVKTNPGLDGVMMDVDLCEDSFTNQS
jgi:hypothetical protein